MTTLKDIINSVDNLPSHPYVLLRLNQLLGSVSYTPAEITSVILLDPALSARMLKLANSDVYDPKTPIGTITDALAIVKEEDLYSLILTSPSLNSFNDVSSHAIDMDSFWSRSVFCGLLTKNIYGSENEHEGEILHQIGLLHDLGMLVLLSHRPEDAKAIIDKLADAQDSLAAIENKQLGFTTAYLGSELLKFWGLPVRIWGSIQPQNKSQRAINYNKEACALDLAIKLCDLFEPRLKTQKPCEMENIALCDYDAAGFNFSQNDINDIVTAAVLESFDTLNTLNPNPIIAQYF